MKLRYLGIIAIAAGTLTLTACSQETEQERLSRLHLPPAGFKGIPALGHSRFTQNCAACHGFSARGTDKGPPLIDNIYRPGHHADLAFHRAVKDGVKQHHWQFGDMPPLGDAVSPKDVGHIIAYIRAAQAKAGIY